MNPTKTPPGVEQGISPDKFSSDGTVNPTKTPPGVEQDPAQAKAAAGDYVNPTKTPPGVEQIDLGVSRRVINR